VTCVENGQLEIRSHAAPINAASEPVTGRADRILHTTHSQMRRGPVTCVENGQLEIGTHAAPINATSELVTGRADPILHTTHSPGNMSLIDQKDKKPVDALIQGVQKDPNNRTFLLG